MEDAQHDVEKGELPVVGVNAHRMADEDDKLLREVTKSKIETWHRHTQTIENFKRERNSASLRQRLDGVAAAAGSGNIVPAAISALDASATIGEIVTTMRSALGMPPDLFDHPLPGENTVDRHVA